MRRPAQVEIISNAHAQVGRPAQVEHVDRPAQVEGITRGFYVDFVIKLKKGPIALFDTKTPDSDPEFVNKHNALHKYIQKQNEDGQQLLGGIIISKEKGVWKYCDNLITSSKDTTGWVSFDPALIS